MTRNSLIKIPARNYTPERLGIYLGRHKQNIHSKSHHVVLVLDRYDETLAKFLLSDSQLNECECVGDASVLMSELYKVFSELYKVLKGDSNGTNI